MSIIINLTYSLKKRKEKENIVIQVSWVLWYGVAGICMITSEGWNINRYSHVIDHLCGTRLPLTVTPPHTPSQANNKAPQKILQFVYIVMLETGRKQVIYEYLSIYLSIYLSGTRLPPKVTPPTTPRQDKPSQSVRESRATRTPGAARQCKSRLVPDKWW